MRYLWLLLIAGCGGENGVLPPPVAVDPGAPPTNGLQVVLPMQRGFAPGSSNEICTWTDQVINHDVAVRSIEGFQSAGGHHLILFATQKHQPAGTTRECIDQDMATFQLIAATAGGEGASHQVAAAPGNLAFRIAAGSQLVINHHYLNASPKPMDGASAMNVFFGDPKAEYTQSSWLVLLDTSLSLKPGTPSIDIHCTLPRDVRAWWIAPHMHRWGTRITIDRKSGGNTDRLFDVSPWGADDAFHPPNMKRDPANAILFQAGDEFSIHCDWKIPNDGTPYTFGKEMCLMFAQTVDETKEGGLTCDQGKWTMN